MNLFIHAVSSEGRLLLFDSAGTIHHEQGISLLLNESSKLIWTVAAFLQASHVSYEDVENIVVIHGPGSFTGIRTIVLYVNSLAFIYPHILLTPLSFFWLYDSYPIAKKSSKRDLFVKRSENAIIEIVQNDVFLAEYSDKTVYGDIWDIHTLCDASVEYSTILKSLQLKKEKSIEPLYIKKPNIS